MTIGKRIAAARKQKSLTQRQLAAQLHLSDKAISRWERDESEPDLNSLIQMAKILETTTDALLTGADAITQYTQEIPPAKHSRFPLSVAISVAGCLVSLICSCILEPGIRTGGLAGIDYRLSGYCLSFICSLIAACKVIFTGNHQETEENITKTIHYCIFLLTLLAANSAAIFDTNLINILILGCFLGEIGFLLSTGITWHILTPILLYKSIISKKPGLIELRLSVTTVYTFLMAMLLWITLAAGFYKEIFLVIGSFSIIPITILFAAFYLKKKHTL